VYWLRLAQERAERYLSPFTLFEFILVVTFYAIWIHFSCHLMRYLYLYQLSHFLLFVFISGVTFVLFVFISVITFCVICIYFSWHLLRYLNSFQLSPYALFVFISVVTFCVICIYFSCHILCYLYLFQLSHFVLFVFISVVTFCVLSVSNDVLNVRVPYGCSCHNATNDNKQVCMCTVVIITEL